MKVCSTQGQATAGWGNLFLQILCHFCGRLLRLFTPWSHARSISPVCLEPTILRGGVAEGRRIVAETFDPLALGMPDAVFPLPCPLVFASPLALHARMHACTQARAPEDKLDSDWRVQQTRRLTFRVPSK